MSYLNFNKKELVNLSFSLERELLRSNRRGAYSSTTLLRCNTRKYHGLLVAPQPMIDDELHVLLSSIDPTIIQNNTEFHLGIHQYPNNTFSPKGHKYVNELQSDPIPLIRYKVGGVILTVEHLFSSSADRIYIRYTLVDCHSKTKLRFKPYLAFRSRHKLSKANDYVNRKYTKIGNGASFRMYQGYTPVYMQFSKSKVEYIHQPDWYYNVEYREELIRGYEGHEDLYVPGYFETEMKRGESIVLAVGTEEINTRGIKQRFQKEFKNRIPRSNFKNTLFNSAEQFIQKRDGRTEIIAGFPWFGRWGRDTFVSLPGLTLSTGKPELCKDVLDTLSKELKGPLFPNMGGYHTSVYNSIDAPMWYFWAIQKYVEYTGKRAEAWKTYGGKMKMILNGYEKGTEFNIGLTDKGLVKGGVVGKALTWMDAVSNGKAITPRIGSPVEINALWYNAMMFALELAKENKDTKFVKKWQPKAEAFPAIFQEAFWSDELKYLADYVNGEYKDFSVRPNMIFAVSLPYSPLTKMQQNAVVNRVKKELLTTRGLRTLSPKHPDYQGHYQGGQAERDSQYHQGTVWAWLFGHYAEAYLKINKRSGVRKIESYLEEYESTLREHGVGSISEIYDGDPPHEPKGSISQAWSVAEVLRTIELLEKMKPTC